MDWKEYEREIEDHFRSEYPSARITANAKLVGHISKTERQIDLLIEEQICDLTFRIAIDAKHHGRKIDVKQVEEFLGLVRDVGVHTGIMIALEGYTEAAVERAHKDDADVILDVLNFKELEHEFLYINFWHKKEPAPDLQSLFKHQESYMRKGNNPVSEIEFIDGVRRPDVPTAIRIARLMNRAESRAVPKPVE